MDKLCYSVREAAEALGIAPTTIRKMINAGQLPAVRVGIGRGRYVIAKRALDDLLSGKVA